MTGPTEPPFDPPDPNHDFYAPPDYPRFMPPGPGEMPRSPVPPPGRMLCPQCGALFGNRVGRHQEGDFAVCGHCAMVLVFMENGLPRLPTYDEAVEAEAHPGIRFLIANSRPEWWRVGMTPEAPAPA